MSSGDRALLLGLAWITMGNFIVMTLVYGLQFFAMGLGGNPLAVMLYTCLSGVSLLVSLAPGALEAFGVEEG